MDRNQTNIEQLNADQISSHTNKCKVEDNFEESTNNSDHKTEVKFKLTKRYRTKKPCTFKKEVNKLKVSKTQTQFNEENKQLQGQNNNHQLDIGFDGHFAFKPHENQFQNEGNFGQEQNLEKVDQRSQLFAKTYKPMPITLNECSPSNNRDVITNNTCVPQRRPLARSEKGQCFLKTASYRYAMPPICHNIFKIRQEMKGRRGRRQIRATIPQIRADDRFKQQILDMKQELRRRIVDKSWFYSTIGFQQQLNQNKEIIT